MKRIYLSVLYILGMTVYSFGYDNKTTHRDFNDAIVAKFKTVVSEWPEFKNYAFGFDLVKVTGPAVTASGKLSVTTEDRNFNLLEWIKEGGYSADEPEAPAAYRHFYDPVSNDGKSYLTDINAAGAQFNPNVDAVFWHFMGNDINGNNDWSWYKGKENMTKAIAEADEKLRGLYLAQAFRALGEVLHNTADMGCPPHVRNDAHGGFGLGGSDPIEGNFQSVWITNFSGSKCDAVLSNAFKASTNAMNINKELGIFTNKYFFSDETISGIGAEDYSSRNGKKNYAGPKIDKLQYETETFNYNQTFNSSRKVQMCNDQSVLLGFLTQNFRSYPRVTLKNCESQASELVPAILAGGSYVMRQFFPVLSISLEVKPADKKIEGSVIHAVTGEYPNAIKYNGKVSFLVDGKISASTVAASNGTFTITDTDKKFPSAKKIVAYIELAGIMIKSNEFDFSATSIYNQFDFGWTLPTTAKSTNLLTNQITNYPVGNAAGSGFTGAITKGNNEYTGSWNITDKNPKSEGSIKVTMDGEKTATVEFVWNSTYTNGDYTKLTILTKALPFKYKVAGGQSILFETAEAFKNISQYSEKSKKDNVLWDYTVVEKDVNNLTGGISIQLYVK